MAHQSQLEKEKYRQWVKAGLGLTYLREGLAPFCVDIANQQQKDIFDTIKQTNNLTTIACGQCNWTTLRPDHSKGGNRSCSLGQRNCNCCNPAGKTACPNKVCGAIYDAIVTSHGFTPPAPFWKNTDTQHWCTDPWSIAKCFINAPGYDKKASAADIDCIGLLHLIRNNQYFHNHIQCKIAQTDVFSKVLTDRNEIFHSSTMELEETDANTYIDDMITVLQDGKELINRTEAQDAVKKLLELKKDDFIITTKSEADVLHAAVQSISDTIEDFEQKLREKLINVPTTEDVEGLQKRVTTLELDMTVVKEEIKDLKTVRSTKRDQYDYVKSKLDLSSEAYQMLKGMYLNCIQRLRKAFQDNLMSLYRWSLLKVSTIPLQPDRKLCNFGEVYVRPRMTCETKDENGRPKETEIQSISDIFQKTGSRLKSIYLVGDAGSGKSSFCRSLVNDWCLAHSKDKYKEDKYTFGGIEEMKKFEFLFYISLRHCKYDVSIQEMLGRQYKENDLQHKLLKEESAKVLIMLDGLDEWSPNTEASSQFQTEGLPERDLYKDYVVITTSRPWKIETLGITDKEIDKRLELKGFDELAVTEMIDNTVLVLNQTFGKNKDSSNCNKAITGNSKIADIKHIPIMLQQLACLWFEDKLHRISRCAIYTGMLELFFKWNVKKHPDESLFIDMRKKSYELKNVELPESIIRTEECKSYKYLIQGIARLAYETLFNNPKETSLTFDSFLFEQLGIDNEIKVCCLKLGILSEDRCPSLSVSTSQRSSLSFFHKSVQEYLAAVYVASKFKSHIGPSGDAESASLSEKCADFLKRVFFRCTTLDEILEQANVLTMLCGLEPRIATSISRYIYDIVSRDKRVLEYRRAIDSPNKHVGLISNIQQCILNCIEEVRSSQTNIQSSFYLGDIVLFGGRVYERFCTVVDKQQLPADTLMKFSIGTHDAEKYVKRVLIYLQKCRRLEAICIDCRYNCYILDDEDIKSIGGTIEDNISTLKVLSVNSGCSDKLTPIYKTVVCRLSDMSHLVALQIADFKVTHEDLTSLCTILPGTSQLEQISIYYIDCECGNQHEVDLSKHQQLQYLEYNEHVCVTRVNTSNLEIYKCTFWKSMIRVEILDSLSTANKLTTLTLQSSDYGLTHRANSDRTHSYHTVTDKLITLLPLLHQLRELELVYFTFTDNIIKCPYELKSMKSISFRAVTMSVTTWRKFVDSVPGMPLQVQVKSSDMCIIPDREGYNHDTYLERRGGEEAAAWQYVREQKALFNVKVEYERSGSIDFSAKK